MRKVAELTRIDGAAIWLNGDQVVSVEHPLTGDHAGAGARVRLSCGQFLLVREVPEEAAQFLWNGE